MIEGILILVLCVFTASAGHLKGRVSAHNELTQAELAYISGSKSPMVTITPDEGHPFQIQPERHGKAVGFLSTRASGNELACFNWAISAFADPDEIVRPQPLSNFLCFGNNKNIFNAFDTSNELEKNVFLSLNDGEAFHDVMKAANGLGGGSELYPYPLDTSTEELRSTMWSPQFWTTKKVKKEQFKLLMPAFMKTLARANGMEPTASGASSPYKICTKTEKAKLTRMNCVEGEHWWLEIGHPDQATNKVSWKIYTEPSFFGQVKIVTVDSVDVSSNSVKKTQTCINVDNILKGHVDVIRHHISTKFRDSKPGSMPASPPLRPLTAGYDA